MSPSSFSLLTAILLAGPLVAGCMHTPASVVTRREWIEIRSAHFTLWSDLTSEQTRALARDLELFRATVLLITRVEDLSSTHPTWLYAFDGEASFQHFNSQEPALGYMMPTLRANVLALSRNSSVDTSTIIKHEYTHWMIRNGSERVYPLWFDEGFAEFMSMLGEDDGMIELGKVAEHRIPNLRHSRWIPLEEILEPRRYDQWSDERKSMLYAEAWAFVHYWYTDLERRELFLASLPRYLGALHEGTPGGEAFQASFGMSVDEANDALLRYLRTGRFMIFGLPVSKVSWSDELSERRLPEHEAAERLGMLCYMGGDPDCARALFEHALALQPASSRATAGLGDVEKSARDFEKARTLFDRAVELDPHDALSLIDRAEFSTLRASQTEDPAQRRRRLRSARRDLVRANEIDGPRAETYAMYGATFLFDGEDPAKGLQTLEEAHRLLPADHNIRLMLADLYLRLDRRKEALAMARAAFMTGHRGQPDEASQAILDEIESGARKRLWSLGEEGSDAGGDPRTRLRGGASGAGAGILSEPHRGPRRVVRCRAGRR